MRWLTVLLMAPAKLVMLLAAVVVALAALVIALATLLMALAAPAFAAEMRAHGDVVDVEPLTGAASAGPADHCQPPRPDSSAGLAELLAWDLRVTCPPAAAPVTGYRVYYRWDGRVYSQVMRERPGPTVPLRVRLD
jgi:hypothetical protein